MEEKKILEPRELAETIIKVLDARKGRDIKLLHVTEKTILADYFIICGGNSTTQVKGLSDEVEYKLGLAGVDPIRNEGKDGNNWRVLDYASVLVHVFDREAREFYNLDKLYTDFE